MSGENVMQMVLRTSELSDYRKFLKIKALPNYRMRGCLADFPDEYAATIGGLPPPTPRYRNYEPSGFLFDYQRDIALMAMAKKKFAIFADCGLGKTLIYAEWIRHVLQMLPLKKKILIISPLMVIDQTMAEFHHWYNGDLPCVRVSSSGLQEWMDGESRLGITNFEALNNPVDGSRLGALVIDESSMLKSHYGKWGREILRLGRGLEWKLCGTGTPAPNDRIEYANHAVFLDAFPNVNSFLARYFVNRGQTNERWELKPHALQPFYRAIGHWCIFLARPASYGWKDHANDIPPIFVNVHDVPLTPEQRSAAQEMTGSLVVTQSGGIGQRSRLGQLAKGRMGKVFVPTNKATFIKTLVESWPAESTLVWCHYNDEQDMMAATFPDAANIAGSTLHPERMRMIDDFKAGRRRVLISKPRILGFGLNLQVATRQVFSGLQDSYESYYQAVKRSNRVGSTRPLNVHIPVTELERPMIETVLEKSARVQRDAEEQEEAFRASITR